MSQQRDSALALPVIARCNVTEAVHTIPAYFPQLPLTGRAVLPAGEIIANCPTGDGTATSVGQIFDLIDGEIVYTETFVTLHNKWDIFFERCVVDSQELGSNNEYMYSTVYFKIKRGDEFDFSLCRDFSCTIRQSYGGDFSFETIPLTVMPPIELQGVINSEQFNRGVEAYYRGLVGGQGSIFHLGSNVRNIRMHNMNLVAEMELTIDAATPPVNNAWENSE